MNLGPARRLVNRTIDGLMDGFSLITILFQVKWILIDKTNEQTNEWMHECDRDLGDEQISLLDSKWLSGLETRKHDRFNLAN